MSDDLIKRSDAIKAMRDALVAAEIPYAVNALFKVPSADRPQGEWIEHKEKTIVMDNNFVDFFPTEYECSNCGLREAHYFINSKPHKYCPNCGARMKGADDE